MELLISTLEIAELAFSKNDNIRQGVINDTEIYTAQIKFIKPALGNLYPMLHKQEYNEFLNKRIKPAIAWFVKYQIINRMNIKIDQDGISQMSTVENRKNADRNTINQLRKETWKTANNLLKNAIEYIRINPERFSEFDNQKYINHAKINGGIII